MWFLSSSFCYSFQDNHLHVHLAFHYLVLSDIAFPAVPLTQFPEESNSFWSLCFLHYNLRFAAEEWQVLPVSRQSPQQFRLQPIYELHPFLVHGMSEMLDHFGTTYSVSWPSRENLAFSSVLPARGNLHILSGAATMKLDVIVLRYLSKDDFRVFTSVKMGIRNASIILSIPPY
ncbi:hypothetical protein HHK36_001451 [Tetracentron sinense]|uniref:Uncharacterized protein n=1 Tax=Tetracentron sinense TaxID=13715 RepID=A0A835DUS1_TETSI|nr:hypothetical protein HHK36_001451 [Tetracentron sinense]